MRFSLVTSLLIALALAAIAGSARSQTPAVDAPPPAVQTLTTQSVEVASKSGVHVFTVEIADTPDTRARGLMERRSLPAGRGMLFDFGIEGEHGFWMKNTYISLDIIFIRADGRILRIAENTEPLSEKLIPSGGPVKGVLEVIGGTTKRLGIAPGDRVSHPIFANR